MKFRTLEMFFILKDSLRLMSVASQISPVYFQPDMFSNIDPTLQSTDSIEPISTTHHLHLESFLPLRLRPNQNLLPAQESKTVSNSIPIEIISASLIYMSTQTTAANWSR